MKSKILISCIIVLIFTIGCPRENQVITPTTPTVRLAAEWEPVIGTIIAWPLIIPKPLVIELAKEKMLLYVMVSDEVNRYEAENTFKEWGVNMHNVHFVVTRLGLAWGWPRDWGPFAVYSDNGAYRLADPQFVTYPLAGPDCDGQVLVIHDLLGLAGTLRPKFVKQYAHLETDITRAVKAFRSEVKKEKFPTDKQSFH